MVKPPMVNPPTNETYPIFGPLYYITTIHFYLDKFDLFRKSFPRFYGAFSKRLLHNLRRFYRNKISQILHGKF